MQVYMCVCEKLSILDEYLVDHCWMLTPDHHLCWLHANSFIFALLQTLQLLTWTVTIYRMTLETVALLAFLSVNLKVIFLALPILPSHVSPQRLRITSLLHMALYKFFYIVLLYCIVYCMSTTGLAYSRWADDDICAINDVHSWIHNCIWRKSPKLRRRQIVHR